MRKLNKKGDVTDGFIVLLIMFFLAVSFIIGIFVNQNISKVIKTTALNQSTAAPNIISTFERLNVEGIQRAYVMIFVLMVVFVMASAFLVRVHPFWMWLYIIMLFATILTAVLLANTYGMLADNPTFQQIIQDQKMITFFMEHAVMVSLIVSALSMVIVFSKLFAAPTAGSFGGDF